MSSRTSHTDNRNARLQRRATIIAGLLSSSWFDKLDIEKSCREEEWLNIIEAAHDIANNLESSFEGEDEDEARLADLKNEENGTAF